MGDFVCPAGTGCGYPQYSVSRGPEIGYRNLAVFYHACGFNCLYFQNHHFKQRTFSTKKISAKQLARGIDKKTTCICYFRGDPTPQILHAIKASKIAIKNAQDGIVRVCWETNGYVQEPYLSMMADLSLNSGGLVKFDLKAWSPEIHHAQRCRKIALGAGLTNVHIGNMHLLSVDDRTALHEGSLTCYRLRLCEFKDWEKRKT